MKTTAEKLEELKANIPTMPLDEFWEVFPTITLDIEFVYSNPEKFDEVKRLAQSRWGADGFRRSALAYYNSMVESFGIAGIEYSDVADVSDEEFSQIISEHMLAAADKAMSQS